MPSSMSSESPIMPSTVEKTVEKPEIKVEPKAEEKKEDLQKNELLHTPHTFQLIDSSIKPLDEKEETTEDPYCFYVIGCADNRPEMQKKVAELMNKNAHKDKPKFILILGDNFTGHGVDSSTDDLFLKNFHDIYQNATVDYINGIPCFINFR